MRQRLASSLLRLALVTCALGSASCATSKRDENNNPDAAKPDAAPSFTSDAGLTDQRGDMVFHRDRYLKDLTFITGERVPGSDHWKEVQDLCATRLAALDFQVERAAYATGVNVIGVQAGKDAPAELVIIGAHYDHLAGCPGADDNGTGLAGTLELARMLAGRTYTRTLVISCWDEEERGLIGSMSQAAQLAATKDEVKIALSFDCIGYVDNTPNSQQVPPGFDTLFPEQRARVAANDFRGDFITVIGDTTALSFMRDYETIAKDNALPTVLLEATKALGPALSNLVRSDHASFWQHDMPAIALTDSANFRNPNYHCLHGQDTIDTIDHVFVEKVVSSAARMTAHALGGSEAKP